MTQTYTLTGMTCGGCEAKVKAQISTIPSVTEVFPSKETKSVTINSKNPISVSAIQNVLDKKYEVAAIASKNVAHQPREWFKTYKPILIIFGYITLLSVLIGARNETIDWMQVMNTFMAGFFLTFSFFKFLDLKGFAESYAMYDIIAKRISAWGYIYACIELLLGLAYVIQFKPLLTNTITFIVMSISIIGVMQSVLNKQKIQCACLGAVFNLPMSTVTIIEDALMIVMSGAMLYHFN